MNMIGCLQAGIGEIRQHGHSWEGDSRGGPEKPPEEVGFLLIIIQIHSMYSHNNAEIPSLQLSEFQQYIKRSGDYLF